MKNVITGVSYWCSASGLYFIHADIWFTLSADQIAKIDQVDGLVDGWVQTFDEKFAAETVKPTPEGLQRMKDMNFEDGVWEKFDGVMPLALARNLLTADQLSKYQRSKVMGW